jgi:predicted outer membrane repeat protein
VEVAITQCIIENNETSQSGGGIDSVNGDISECFIMNNLADINGGGLSNCGENIINCIIADNTAQNAGAMDNCDGDIINCTIVGNEADLTSGFVGGISDCGGNITNTIIWNNSDSTGTGLDAQIQGYTAGSINYSCIQGWSSGGTGNINVLPGPAFGWADPDWDGDDNILGTSDDALIPQNSQCLDSANNAILQNLNIQYDIANNPRIFDRNHDMIAIADMGAYEARASIYYVDGLIAVSGNGSSWASPFKYLTDALAAAGADSEIWVRGSASGITYYPDENAQNPAGTGDRTASFVLPQGVYLLGGFNGTEVANSQRDWTANAAILSGDIDGDSILNAGNSYHVVKGANNTVIDGFAIQGGYADGTGNDAYGGGMLNINASPTIQNCLFISNGGSNGGGMYNAGSSTNYIYPVIDNCLFYQNIITRYGGGIYNYYSHPLISNCTFQNNLINGTSSLRGAGIYNECSNPDIEYCIFTQNIAQNSTIITYGGAIYNKDILDYTTINGNPHYVINRCTFTSNTAGYGGAIYSIKTGGTGNTKIDITNCIFNGNQGITASGTGRGGVIYPRDVVVNLTSCTLYGNAAALGGVIYNGPEGAVVVNNCILWGNTATTGATAYQEASCYLEIYYSDIQGHESSIRLYNESNPPGELVYSNNINIDPSFANAANGDFHLKSPDGRYDPSTGTFITTDTVYSKCLAHGQPGLPYSNELEGGGKIDMGAYGNTEEASKVNSSKLATLGATILPSSIWNLAGWRLSYESSSVWHKASNGSTPYWWQGLVPGSYTVYFKAVSGWTTPNSANTGNIESGTFSVPGQYQ